LTLIHDGPSAAGDGREALALGRLYQRAGREAAAREALERAVTDADPAVLVEALRSLAIEHRRARRHEEAAGCWRALLAVAACPTRLVWEATEALAVHHEHRVRDLAAARRFAARGAEQPVCLARTAAAQHRLARLDRKISRRPLLQD
jgi:hypothetical protein